MTIPEQLKYIKYKLDLTWKELAMVLRVKEQTMTSWHTGKREPRPDSRRGIRGLFEECGGGND
jgi:DNA-binding transcriptional regulator YiaG